MNEQQALLDQLSPLQVPPVSQWPAVGWWLVAASVLLALLVLLWWNRRQRHRVWRREAAKALMELRDAVNEEPATVILARCSVLARRLLLVAEPRSEVASLHGEAWLNKLDAVARQPLFTQGFGRLLLDQPYRRSPQVPAHDLLALIDTLEALLGQIRPGVGSVHAPGQQR